MPEYFFKARNQVGELTEGTRTASNPDNLANELMEQGLVPVSIKTAKEYHKGEKKNVNINLSLGWFDKPSKQTLAAFCRQLYALFRAGVPLPTCMLRLSQTEPNKRLAEALAKIKVELESGMSLAKAMNKHNDVFPPLFSKLIQVGEETGRLESTFLQLSEYLELEADTIKKIKSLMRYPSIVVTAIFIAFTIINLFVIPAFSSFYAQLGSTLPLLTRLMIGSSTFFKAHWVLVFGSLMTVIIALVYSAKTPRGAQIYDRFVLTIPVIGSIFRRILFARFARSLAMVVRSGLPLTHGIDIVAKSLNNYHLESKLLPMSEVLTRGESLLGAARKSGMFTPVMLQMLSVGEESGSIEESLDQMAEFYEAEVDYDIKRLSELMEPFLLIVIGIMVLILALGVFLPMWNIIGAVRAA